jgi:hypothetical protein
VARGAGLRQNKHMNTSRSHRPSRALARPPPQKSCPTAFQLFPNARTIVLVPSGVDYPTDSTWHVEVLDVFRPPRAPADAAAARAALAGVTRLEVRNGFLEPAQLAAALLHLRGLREASLACFCEVAACDAAEAGECLVAALAGCPGLESLEWRISGEESQGAQGLGAGRRTPGRLRAPTVWRGAAGPAAGCAGAHRRRLKEAKSACGCAHARACSS